MLDERIVFDERYDSDAYGTTTLYFVAPKEILKTMIGKDYPEAVSMEISVEFPTDHIEAGKAYVCASPTNENGEDYDWWDVDMPYDEIEALIELAEKEEN